MFLFLIFITYIVIFAYLHTWIFSNYEQYLVNREEFGKKIKKNVLLLADQYILTGLERDQFGKGLNGQDQPLQDPTPPPMETHTAGSEGHSVFIPLIRVQHPQQDR